MNGKQTVIIVAILFLIWYAPLLLPVATLHRYGLEEMRVAVVFFMFGVLLATVRQHK